MKTHTGMRDVAAGLLTLLLALGIGTGPVRAQEQTPGPGGDVGPVRTRSASRPEGGAGSGSTPDQVQPATSNPGVGSAESTQDATTEARSESRPASSPSEPSQGLTMRGDAEPRPSRPGTREEEIDEESGRKPFTPPKKKPPAPNPKWELSLDFGAAFPVPSGRLEAKAGVLVHVRFGYRVVGSDALGLYVGGMTGLANFRSDDSVTLNPDADPSEQVKCEDSKTSNLWLVEAAVWLRVRPFRRLRVVVGASGGGGYGEYRQLSRTGDSSSGVLSCSYDHGTGWTPSAAGFLQVGWILTRDMELLLGGGFRGVFGTARFTYQDADGVVRDRPLFVHQGFVTGVFVHRF